VGAGYFIGSGFVDYALLRDNPGDSTAIPEAAAAIVEPGLAAPAKPQAENEQWTITSQDGLKLVATHFSPDKPSRLWAILVHGYGRNQSYVWDYAAEYIKRGYHVLTPDLRAAGLSEGKYLTMGVKESEEVARWAAQIKAYDPEAEIVLHGVSMGASTVLLAAAREDMPGLVAVIEDCGYTSAYEMFANQLGVIFGLPEFPIMPCVDVVSGFKTGAKVSAAAPLQVMPRIKVPVLFIHGDADTLVPPAMMEELFAACNAKKEKFVVVGAGHGDAMKEAGEEYWQRIFVFLAAEMK
jgi:fermentation-respiration switch protein FrsA (DUF1100 family)